MDFPSMLCVILNEVKDLKTQSGCIQILPPYGRQNDKR